MPYLTIAQASTASGKSEKTIRRLANKPESKPFISKEGNTPNAPILIDANYLQTVYPLTTPTQATNSLDNPTGQSLDTSTQEPMDTDQAQNTMQLQHSIELLKQELRHKEELFRQVTLEKDKRIEVLERSLLLLGEGQRKEAETKQAEPDPEQLGAEVEPQPEQRRKWWKLF